MEVSEKVQTIVKNDAVEKKNGQKQRQECKS